MQRGLFTFREAATLVAPPAGPSFLWRKLGERAPGLCPGPVGGRCSSVRFDCETALPAASWPEWVTACPPAGHAAAIVFVQRPRAPAGGAPWPTCRYRKQDSYHQRKGSRGKKLFPLAFFPPFLMGEMGPRRRRSNLRGREKSPCGVTKKPQLNELRLLAVIWGKLRQPSAFWLPSSFPRRPRTWCRRRRR